jgi:DNA polymerase III sliding clamp (beta) subunit (PCNA family)
VSGELEFTTRRFQLDALAGWALPVVPGNATLLVNSCFQVTVGPGLLRLAATDRRRTVLAVTSAVDTGSEGTVFIPAKKLTAMLSAAPEGDVTVSVKANLATVTAGTACWQLKLPDPTGYAGLPDLDGAEFAPVSREALLGALQTVRHAVGKDGRPAFAQVRIAESGGVMCATACGASLLARAPVPGFPFPVSVPALVLGDLVKLLAGISDKEVDVADAATCVAFRAGPVTLAAQHTGTEFPDVDELFLRQVRGNDQVLEVDKTALTQALRRARINADPSTSAVGLIADGETLTVVARDVGGNSAEEPVPAVWGREQRLLVVNGGFLESMLAVHPPASCVFRVAQDRGKQRAPLLLEDTESGVTGVCVQMPASQVGY